MEICRTCGNTFKITKIINNFREIVWRKTKMPTPQLSPGVVTREVDLTVGRTDNVLDNIGAIAGPFSIGSVDELIDIANE